ncbi:spore protease YyaC [Paenibacillus beijingensis]|uniref:spore protease YyaC n=1 Tax=Paenibacillus beijingensis TaxID=1126833 RepID=UPI000A715B34|nr:spore protease YyaC [Paenibacillus beijingensis]
MKQGSKENRLPDGQSWSRVDEEGLRLFFEHISASFPERDQVVFLCIGSDRSTGDALGPLVGSMLKAQGFPNVIGTLEQPCDADKVSSVLAAYKGIGTTIVAIDACLGRAESVGLYLVRNGPLQPGEAVGQKLPRVGDYSVAVVVGAQGHKPYWIIQTTSLHYVLQMARAVVRAAARVWGGRHGKGNSPAMESFEFLDSSHE